MRRLAEAWRWYSYIYGWPRTRERLERWVAWHLPREVVKWCFYRMTAHATTGQYGNTLVPGLTWETIAERWDDRAKQGATGTPG